MTQIRIPRGLRLVVPALLLLAAACDAGAGDATANASIETDDQKVSYGIGYSVAQGLSPMADRIHVAAIARGITDALAESDAAVPMDDLRPLMQAFQAELMQVTQASQATASAADLAAGEAFLAENGAREGVTTTESGLQYEVLEPGEGPKPGAADRVAIHYRGTLIDGTQFDSSYDRGEPSTFGVGGVIAGFAEGLQLMPVGSKYKLYIPSRLGYGAQGNPSVPPNATLIFEVELLAIE